MKKIKLIANMLADARRGSALSQRELAERAGMTQPSITKLEQGAANPTIETLVRVAAALDCEWRFELVPRSATDAVVERYKADVDRTLLRENLKRSADERVRSLAEWERNDQEFRRAMRRARRA